MKNIQQFVKYGLYRDIPTLAIPPKGEELNLGPGNVKEIRGSTGKLTVGLGHDLQERYVHELWMAGDPIKREANTVAAIHAYQFMEHLPYEYVMMVLEECQRVLMPDGVLNIVVPHAHSQHYTQAMDHKSMWTEETWDWMFNNLHYGSEVLPRMRLHTCFILGVVWRNLDVFSQLVKERP